MKINIALLFSALTFQLIVTSFITPPNQVQVYEDSKTEPSRFVRRHGDHGHHDDHTDHEGHEGHAGHRNSDKESMEDRCSEIQEVEEYDMKLHVGSIFLLMLFSFIGCSLTALSNKIKVFKIPPILIDVGKHFGSGVIISTAFIHMLMSAISNLTNPCLPKAFTSYISFAPLFTMLAALAMHLIEFLVLDHVRKNMEKSTPSVDELKIKDVDVNACSSHSDLLELTERKLSTYILELGILSHSIFIGLSLGVTSGPEFVPLLIAVTFHQFFEGVGLGARISSLNFSNTFKPLLMVLSFSITTSIGISIGVGVHNVYAANSQTSLLVQGIFDAISAGILIYTGLVELLSKEISTKSEFVTKTWGVRVLYLLALYLGIASMAILGVWA